MCWLYYIPNLLVIQYLETLLLFGNNVKVVCEKVWRIDRACAIKRQLATRSRNWLASGASSKCVTRVEHARSWRVRTARSLQEKNYKLAFLLFGNWNSRLIPVANDSLVHPVLLKTNFSHSISYPTINTLIPTKCRKLLERNPREQQDWFIHNLIHLIQQNSSTPTLSIVIPMRGSQAKSLPHHIQSEKVLGVCEVVQKRTNSFWLMQWANCRIR